MSAIYRDFDQETLDREYNARASVADFDYEYGRYVSSSAKAMRDLERISDIVFDPVYSETLDLYPAGPDAPIFLWIHGGYWRALSKTDNAFAARGLVPHGIAVAVMNYSLAPAVTLDEIVRQVRAAVAWLHRHAGAHGMDGRRIHVGGSSAGGHLVGMLLDDAWLAAFDLPSDVIGCVLALSGLFDLEPLVSTHINAWMKLDHPAAERNSPQRLIPKRSQALLLAAVGGLETSEFKRQTAEFAEAWAKAGHAGETIAMPGYNHFDLALSLDQPDGVFVNAVRGGVRRLQGP